MNKLDGIALAALYALPEADDWGLNRHPNMPRPRALREQVGIREKCTKDSSLQEAILKGVVLKRAAYTRQRYT